MVHLIARGGGEVIEMPANAAPDRARHPHSSIALETCHESKPCLHFSKRPVLVSDSFVTRHQNQS
jgi:hypothetical protein